MKKVLTLTLIFTMIICNCRFAFAEKLTAYRSDVKAYIDYTPIESYVINELTYINVEHLVNYGFSVYFDEINNKYIVNRNKFSYPFMTKEMWENRMSRKEARYIENSDITVDFDGRVEECYITSEGEPLVLIDVLSKYGEFVWDGSVNIYIFKNEMLNELEHTENIVEKTTDNYNSYIGQVNGNGEPHGIGMYKSGKNLDHSTIIGYFENGLISGLAYVEWYRTVSRSYTNRYSYFIGNIDKELAPYKVVEFAGIEYKVADGNNFGVYCVPLHYIDEWTGPDSHIDLRNYLDGCYYENWMSKNTTTHSRIWKNHLVQSAEFVNSGYDGSYLSDTVKGRDEFYLYKNENKVYYNGASLTIGKDENGNVVLNDINDGGGFYPFDINVIINGEIVDFDAKPIIESNRTLVPMRKILEKVGAVVIWNEDNASVDIKNKDKSLTFFINKNSAIVDGRQIQLEIAPKIISDRTYIPLRFFSEELGYTVEWNEDIKIVTIKE